MISKASEVLTESTNVTAAAAAAAAIVVHAFKSLMIEISYHQD